MMHTGANPVKYKKSRVVIFSMLIPLCFSLFVLNSCDIFLHDMAKLYDITASAVGRHTVTFNSNGVPINVAAQTVTNGERADRPELPAPANDEPGFLGWFTDNNSFNNIWQFERDTVERDLTLHARWTGDDEFAVEFTEYEGGPVTYVPVAKGGDRKIPPRTVPERDGFVFGGWYTKPGFLTEWDFTNDIVNVHIYLHVKWNIEISFDSNGGDPVVPEKVSVEPPATTVGTANMPANPTRSRYTFAGWNTRPNGSGTAFTGTTQLTNNITVYAQWTPITAVNVTFAMNDGTINNHAVVPVAPGDSLGTLMPENPTRTGWTFAGWYPNTDGTGTQFRDSTTVDANMEVYARWTVTQGIGTYADPFKVYDVVTLERVGSMYNQGGNLWTLAAHYRQIADIDLENFEYNSVIGSLTGSYNGGGHKISNLKITGGDGAGLFFALGAYSESGSTRNGFLQNIHLVNVNISASTATRVGSLVGSNNVGRILNCSVTLNNTNKLEASTRTGGLAGYNSGSIEGSSVSMNGATIIGPGMNSALYFGGLVGYNESGSITNSHVTMDSSSEIEGHSNVGGLVGYVSYASTISGSSVRGGTIKARYQGGSVGGLVGYCYSSASEIVRINTSYTNTTIRTSGNTAGGLVGSSSATISNCYALGDVFGTGSVGYFGGLVGSNSGVIEYSYATGNISGDLTGGSIIGGLVGQIHRGTIRNSYATGNVSGAGYVGGLVGLAGTLGAGTSTDEITIEFCYAAGSVTGQYDYAGGLVGRRNDRTSTIRNNAALNPSVKSSSGGGVGRVIGNVGNVGIAPVIIRNNYGRHDMITTDMNGSTTIVNSLNSLDGLSVMENGFFELSISGAGYYRQGWWSAPIPAESIYLPGEITSLIGPGFTSGTTSNWSLAINRLPHLNGMPGTHVQNPVIKNY